jgi:hypothetical protein
MSGASAEATRPDESNSMTFNPPPSDEEGSGDVTMKKTNVNGNEEAMSWNLVDDMLGGART